MVPWRSPAPRCWQKQILLSLLILQAVFFRSTTADPGQSSANSPKQVAPASDWSHSASAQQGALLSDPQTYLLTVQLGGPGAAATPGLLSSVEETVANWTKSAPNNCRVVEAANVTSCINGVPTPAPTEAIAPPVSGPSELGQYLRQIWQSSMPPGADEDQQTVDFQQFGAGIPNAGRRLFEAEPSVSPLEGSRLLGGASDARAAARHLQSTPAPKGSCVPLSEITLQMTFSNDTDDMMWNKTLDFFYSGRFLAKMQAAGVNLENAQLLGYQEPASSMPQAPSDLIHGIPSDKPDTVNLNPPGAKTTTYSPLAFSLEVIGDDAQVTNDTMLAALYSLVTMPSANPGSAWLTPENTAIIDVRQETPQPVRVDLGRRLMSADSITRIKGAVLRTRRMLQQVAPPPMMLGDPMNAQFNVTKPAVEVRFRLQAVPSQAVLAVKDAVDALVGNGMLLRGFTQRGISVYQVNLQSFSFQPNPVPAPASSPPAPAPVLIYSTRKGSNGALSAIITAAVVPVSVLAIVLGLFAFWWYRRQKRRALMDNFSKRESQQQLKLKASSLFGGSSDGDRSSPSVSASVVIRQMRPDRPPQGPLLEMPWSDWQIDPSELTILTKPDGSEWLLGTGASGRVYKALRSGVQVVAVKLFKEEMTRGAITSLTSSHHAMQFRREISILKSCHDRNIVHFLGACLTEGQTILVTEYLENGDLYNAINSQQGSRYHWYRMQLPDGQAVPNSGMARRVALDVARGLHFLHTKKIVHFDLKSANILLARDFTAKIADVGLARILHDDVLSTRREVGTFAWAAPEVLLGQRCTEAADIYSFGVLLHELSAIESPLGRQLRKLKVPEDCPPEVIDLMFRCLDPQPHMRPSARDLVAVLSCLPVVPPFPPPVPRKGRELPTHSRHNSFTARHSFSIQVPTIREQQ